MADLVISQKDKELFRYSFEQGIIGIGRGVANEIHLNSPVVSDQHARISLFDGACHIQNMAPGGDTFVNEREVERTRLYDKDVLNIGHYKIVLLDEALLRPETEADQENHGQRFGALESIEPGPQAEGKVLPGGEENDVTPEADATIDEARVPGPSWAKEDAPDQAAGEEDEAGVPPLTVTANSNDLSVDEGVGLDQRNVESEPAEQSANHDKVLMAEVFEKRRQSQHGLLTSGIEVLAGPAKGNRVYFSQQSATLGVDDEAVVLIKSMADGYVVLLTNRSFEVTINGDSVIDFPANISNGDQIDFGNISVRFFVEN